MNTRRILLAATILAAILGITADPVAATTGDGRCSEQITESYWAKQQRIVDEHGERWELYDGGALDPGWQPDGYEPPPAPDGYRFVVTSERTVNGPEVDCPDDTPPTTTPPTTTPPTTVPPEEPPARPDPLSVTYELVCPTGTDPGGLTITVTNPADQARTVLIQGVPYEVPALGDFTHRFDPPTNEHGSIWIVYVDEDTPVGAVPVDVISNESCLPDTPEDPTPTEPAATPTPVDPPAPVLPRTGVSSAALAAAAVALMAVGAVAVRAARA